MNNRSKTKKIMPLEKRFTIGKRLQPKPRVASPDMTLEQRNILELVNSHRRQGFACNGECHPPVRELRWNNQIYQAAISHAREMAMENYFSHQGLHGSDAMQRMIQNGFQGTYFGENIAVGHHEFSETILNLLNSPEHCRNLMNSNYRYLAMAVACNPESTYKMYWVQKFGG